MRRGVRPAVVFVALLLALAGPVEAATKRRPSAPPPGFAVDAARIELLADGGAVRLEGVGEYRGALELRRAAAGVGAVNDVSLEDYLKGIAEMPAGWPAEALRAQAIAARTYALWVLGAGAAGEAAGLGAQICATESCQVYAGLAKEQSPNGANWAAAVEATRGQVLLSGGKPIVAKYSSSNGGRSISGGRPYLRPVDDPDDARSPLHRWTLAVSYDDLGRALAAPGPVRTARLDGGGLVLETDLPDGGGAGPPVSVALTDFRAKVNAVVPPPAGRTRTVPSIMFALRADDGARVATLDGRGYGHGIGMSQYGAYGKALRGLKAAAILAAYYGGLRPSTLPHEQLPAHVRVAIDPGRPAAVVGASGPFRVLDGKGNVIAAVATGAWRVAPSPKGLRLVPPPGQTGTPGVQLVGVDPPTPGLSQAVTVRLRSNLPAFLSVNAQPPGGAEAPVMAPQPVGTEEVELTLPGATQPGTYLVTVTANSGTGRVATLALVPQVVGPAPAAASPPDANAVSAPATPVPQPPSRASRSLRPAAARAPISSARPPNLALPIGAGVTLVALAGAGSWLWQARFRRRKAS